MGDRSNINVKILALSEDVIMASCCIFVDEFNMTSPNYAHSVK